MRRLCIDQLRSARHQREDHYGVLLPEPLMAAPDAESDISEELENLLTMAFTLMLETLRPVERAVFLLREVFDYKYADTAAIVGKEERMTRTALSVSGKGEVLVRDRAHFREANPFVASCEEPRPAFG